MLQSRQKKILAASEQHKARQQQWLILKASLQELGQAAAHAAKSISSSKGTLESTHLELASQGHFTHAKQAEVPFEKVKTEIQEKLSVAAEKLVKSSLAQAEITKNVVGHIGQYHAQVKNIASTMGKVLTAKSVLTKAYHEDIASGEKSRLAALEVNVADLFGEDAALPRGDFSASEDHSQEQSNSESGVGGGRQNQTQSGRVPGASEDYQDEEAGEQSNLESGSDVNQTAHLETGPESQNLDSSSDDLAGASDVSQPAAVPKKVYADDSYGRTFERIDRHWG